MWELDHKEGWAPKNWSFRIVMLEKTLESPMDCKDIKAVNPKGNQPWIFIGRTEVETEAPILWPPDAKSNSLEKTLRLVKIEGKRRWRWNGWIASLTQRAWIWANFKRYWSTEEPDMVQSMASQKVKYDLTTEQKQ